MPIKCETMLFRTSTNQSSSRRRQHRQGTVFLLLNLIQLNKITTGFTFLTTTQSQHQQQQTHHPHIISTPPLSPFTQTTTTTTPSSTSLFSSSSSSSNPNDYETPSQRALRMSLVSQIQKSFYSNETGIPPPQHGIFTSIPLWRVPWVELPGYQNTLNVWQPHYTHMFNKIINGPQPWYFCHVYLPGGTDNLDNEEYHLKEGNTKASLTGVLMKISDYSREEDGRLTVIVQAMERCRVVDVERHVPYAIATVALTPDEELMESHRGEATSAVMFSSAPCLVDEGTSEETWRSVAWKTARVGAVAEAMYWHPFEFRHVGVEKTMTRAGAMVNGVSPLVNFDKGGWEEVMAGDNVEDVVSRAMEEYLLSTVENGDCGDDDEKTTATDLNNDYGDRIMNYFQKETKDDFLTSISTVFELEYQTWIELDQMVRLLTKAYPNGVPIPTQMMGLLPSLSSPTTTTTTTTTTNTRTWPDEFTLQTFVNVLESDENSTVGTHSRSPFVRVDSPSRTYRRYPSLRRAQRLSFVVWTLLEQILVQGIKTLPRQEVLEMTSVSQRLMAATERMTKINGALKQLITENNGGGV